MSKSNPAGAREISPRVVQSLQLWWAGAMRQVQDLHAAAGKLAADASVEGSPVHGAIDADALRKFTALLCQAEDALTEAAPAAPTGSLPDPLQF